MADQQKHTPLRPFCNACGWRKGGPDSWDGAACKCGHTEAPTRHVETNQVFYLSDYADKTEET